MRLTAIALLAAVAVTGCGSDSKNAESRSAGIELSIPNTSQPKPSADAAKATINQYT